MSAKQTIATEVVLNDPKTKTQSTLALTESGLTLNGTLINVESLRYHTKMLGDLLEVGGVLFDIPRGKAESVRHCIFATRHPKKRELSYETRAKTIDPISPLHRIFLEAHLESEEVLLVFLESGSKKSVPSALQKEKVPLYLLVTTHRQELVAVTSLGDTDIVSLDERPLAIEKRVGQDRMSQGEVRFELALLNESLFHELKDLPPQSPAERCMNMARIHTPARESESDSAKAAAAFLGEAFALRSSTATLALWSLKERLHLPHEIDDAAIEHALRDIATHDASNALIKFMREFNITLDDGRTLLHKSLVMGFHEWALDWHTYLRAERLTHEKDEVLGAEIDLEYADHLLVVKRYADVCRVLEARLNTLPSEELADLLPSGADLTGRGAQVMRIEILDRLSLARGEGTPDQKTLKELAALSPLVKERVQVYRDASEGEERLRAEEVLKALQKDALGADLSAGDDALEHVAKLSKKILFEKVRHPVAREGGALEKLQTFLAKSRVPNKSALQNYCERLSEKSDVHAPASLADASMALGLKGVAAFVSRGDLAVGVRAYEGSPSFLLIGGRHLEKGSPFRLQKKELRFLVATEMAHLRFQHSRVTQDDVWKGAVDKGKFGVDILMSAVPLLKGVEIIDRIGKIIDRYDGSIIGRVTKGVDLVDKTATKMRGKKVTGRKQEKSLDVGNRQLIAAHRVMQLTADRMGLLLCADLNAALRAIFLSDPEYLAELPVAQRHGLQASLSRRNDEGELLFEDLSIRLAALIGFYLSDDYTLLRQKIIAQEG